MVVRERDANLVMSGNAYGKMHALIRGASLGDAKVAIVEIGLKRVKGVVNRRSTLLIIVKSIEGGDRTAGIVALEVVAGVAGGAEVTETAAVVLQVGVAAQLDIGPNSPRSLYLTSTAATPRYFPIMYGSKSQPQLQQHQQYRLYLPSSSSFLGSSASLTQGSDCNFNYYNSGGTPPTASLKISSQSHAPHLLTAQHALVGDNGFGAQSAPPR